MYPRRAMEREPIGSSVIAAVGYDSDEEVLEIEFRSGRVYQYFDVPRRVHKALLAADSLGAYFNTRIKPRYRSAEVR